MSDSDVEDSVMESEEEEEDSKKKKKSPAKKSTKKNAEKEKKTPTKKKSTSNKENEKPSASKKKKDDKDTTVKALNETQAGPKLIEYMREQNRPHSLIAIFENLKGLIKKPVLTKLLDKFSADNTFTCKINGKQKLYFITQDPKLTLSDAEMNEKDAIILKLQEELKQQSQAAQKATQEWNVLKNELTTDELTKKVAEKEKEVTTLKAKLEKLTGANAVMISREEMTTITKRFEYYVKEWRKRKKACTNTFDDMMQDVEDNLPKNERMSNFGLETDEECGQDVATYEALIPTKRAPGMGCKRLKTG